MALMNNQPIGIFDSGVGGLSITKHIKQQLPYEKLIYVADTLHAPYGNKTTDSIIERVNTLSKKLLQQQVKALVVACNTATVNTIDQLRKQITIPIIGVEPAIKPATIYSKNGKVGVLVTQATATNSRFLALVDKFTTGVDIIIQACPGLVELIEQGKINSPQCETLLSHYLTPLINKEVDTIVLGCTHYPFLLQKIKTICGDSIKVMDTAAPVTNELQRQLQKHQLCTAFDNSTSIEFFSSKPSLLLDSLSTKLFEQSVSFKLF